MARDYKHIGKPTNIPDGDRTLDLQPVLCDDKYFIEWSTSNQYSKVLSRWKTYWGSVKRKNGKDYCLTAREARKVINDFARLEKSRSA